MAKSFKCNEFSIQTEIFAQSVTSPCVFLFFLFFLLCGVFFGGVGVGVGGGIFPQILNCSQYCNDFSIRSSFVMSMLTSLANGLYLTVSAQGAKICFRPINYFMELLTWTALEIWRASAKLKYLFLTANLMSARAQLSKLEHLAMS